MTAVLIYTRLSTEDVHDATVRQEVACRSYADARNWDVVATLSDLDVSAYQPRARRPGFEALIAEAAARSADGVLVWKLDRLVRRPKDFERLWEVAERRGVLIASVTEPVDSSSPIGLAMLRILVALAGLESATTGIRVRASKRQAAEEGRPPPVKAYGLTPRWDRIVESEAAVLREAAPRVIGGERLASLARELRSRDIPSPSGRRWTDATLGRLLRNPRIVGDRVYKGQVVARDCWPAILDRETFARLQLTLNHPGQRGAPPRHHKRLATGFAQCGLCGQNMATTTRSGQRYYSCPTQPSGCGRIHVRSDRLKAWLLDRLLEQLRLEPPPTAQDADPGDTAQAMAQLCRDYYVDRIVSRAAFLSARALLGTPRRRTLATLWP
jgi:site-specific DNA recombinase